MDPKQFSWTEDQQVTVTNPTSTDHKFKVHGKEYQVRAGETAKMVGYIAWSYVHGLAFQMVQNDGLIIRWNEEGFRKAYFDKIVVGTDEAVSTVEPEPTIETLSSPVEDDEIVETVIQPMTAEVKRGRPAKA